MTTENKDAEEPPGRKSIGIKQRLKHFTWAWFTCTMSTGGLAIAIAQTPNQFSGLLTIGTIVFLFNLALFLLLTTCMAARAILHPTHFTRSLTNPPESLFTASFLLTLCITLCNAQLYGLTHGPCGPWLTTALRTAYWLYAGVSLLFTTTQFFALTLRAPVPFAPSWFLPGYAAMLTGTLAAFVAPSQPPAQRLPILVSGCAFQGFGFALSMLLVGLYVAQLMAKGLPPAAVRPAMFIPVGTPAYTIVAVLGQARALPEGYGYFAGHSGAAEVLRTLALVVGIALWVLSFWLFGVAVLACLWTGRGRGKMGFALPWWAFVFPNVGFTVATAELGREMGSEGVMWVGSGMLVGLVLVWGWTGWRCVGAVVRGEIVWPGRDEDRNV